MDISSASFAWLAQALPPLAGTAATPLADAQGDAGSWFLDAGDAASIGLAPVPPGETDIATLAQRVLSHLVA
jgi:hypothetical protein